MRAAGRTHNPLADKLEKQWDNDLFSAKDGLATMLGWDSYWTFRSKGSRAGFPDRTVCRERILYAELKREEKVATPLTDAQREWLDKLARAGGEVYLWRPSDLGEIARVLGKPWKVTTDPRYRLGLPLMDRSFHACWTPNSLWIPGQGRADTIKEAA